LSHGGGYSVKRPVEPPGGGAARLASRARFDPPRDDEKQLDKTGFVVDKSALTSGFVPMTSPDDSCAAPSGALRPADAESSLTRRWMTRLKLARCGAMRRHVTDSTACGGMQRRVARSAPRGGTDSSHVSLREGSSPFRHVSRWHTTRSRSLHPHSARLFRV
jgi:hypothetical protein